MNTSTSASRAIVRLRTTFESCGCSIMLLVLHLGLREQDVAETEILQVTHAHRVQDAVEMVAFMLHYARMKTAYRAVNQRAVFIPTLVAQMRIARHQTAHARHAEAPLPAVLHRVGQRRDDRIDEHSL